MPPLHNMGERPTLCEICGGVEVSPRYVMGNASYYRCRSCHHLFLWPKPSDGTTTHYYQDPSFYDSAEARTDMNRVSYRHRLAILGTLAACFGLERRLIDVGCATGHFLDEASKTGWSVCGQEISSPLAATARDRYGFEVVVGDLKQFPKDRKYPVVTAWEVLEHVLDARNLLHAIHALLQPGGLFALSTPLSDGLPARIMGRKFPMLLPKQHLCLFSNKSIRLLMSGSGFEIIHSESFSNLDSESLASGMIRILGYPGKEDAPAPIRRLLGTAGQVLSFLPRIVDQTGLGSELFLICRTPGGQP